MYTIPYVKSTLYSLDTCVYRMPASHLTSGRRGAGAVGTGKVACASGSGPLGVSTSTARGGTPGPRVPVLQGQQEQL